MAECKEVIRQWVRMCTSFSDKAYKECVSCTEFCPISVNPVCGEITQASPKDVSDFEEIVMKWVEENPEPVYPTWSEYLNSIGLSYWKKLDETHIPPDIAEKLGLKPKEVK